MLMKNNLNKMLNVKDVKDLKAMNEETKIGKLEPVEVQYRQVIFRRFWEAKRRIAEEFRESFDGQIPVQGHKRGRYPVQNPV
jgi:hypothetical protein